MSVSLFYAHSSARVVHVLPLLLANATIDSLPHPSQTGQRQHVAA